MDQQSSETLIPSGYLTGPELYALISFGYEPIGVVIGVAAVSMGSRGFGRSIRAIFTKGEMSAVTDTATAARESATSRANDKAKALGAELMLVQRYDVRDLAEIVEITCTATACKKTAAGFRPMSIATATS